jgi:hypothetical protein
MNCCDDYGDCNQGRDCPIRKGYGTRRARAGEPVTDELPIKYWHNDEPEEIEPPYTLVDAVSAAVVLTILFIIAAMVFGRLP